MYGFKLHGTLLILVSVVTRFVSISTFASLVGIPTGIANFAIGLKIWWITAVIKTFKLIIKKKRKKHHKIVLLAKAKSNTI